MEDRQKATGVPVSTHAPPARRAVRGSVPLNLVGREEGGGRPQSAVNGVGRGRPEAGERPTSQPQASLRWLQRAPTSPTRAAMEKPRRGDPGLHEAASITGTQLRHWEETDALEANGRHIRLARHAESPLSAQPWTGRGPQPGRCLLRSDRWNLTLTRVSRHSKSMNRPRSLEPRGLPQVCQVSQQRSDGESKFRSI
jgi:hypothetical protein